MCVCAVASRGKMKDEKANRQAKERLMLSFHRIRWDGLQEKCSR
jgi:hypothetical protein